ncbi:MAG: dihydroorotase [Bacteroidia bacterium]|nr:MAG: dihydroorotase [Bacteroidia bacterium]
MEMPNTKPQTITLELLEEKYKQGAEKSLANYSFYFGATNDNAHLLPQIDTEKVCGVKVFMGSSTGNMLVDKEETLTEIFKNAPTLVAVHCEDEQTIKENKALFIEKYGEDLGVEFHPKIRSAKACYLSSKKAVELAKKHNTRLHILHLSTADEMELFDNDTPLTDKKITAEVCVHHLWFTDKDYKRLGNNIKWNPAIKSETDNHELIKALNSNKLDVVATDHAPHTVDEKQGNCFTAMSGGPLVQHSVVAMLQMAKNGLFSYEKVVEKMCHAPADLFRVRERGYIRKGYYADLVLIDPNASFTVNKENIYYKCGWSPFENETFNFKVVQTFVNGNCVFHNETFNEKTRGKRLLFNLNKQNK